MVYPGDSAGEGIDLDIRSQQTPVVRADLLGIIEQGMEETEWQDHCRRKYRPGITPPSCFITAGLRQLLLVMASQRVFHPPKIQNSRTRCLSLRRYAITFFFPHIGRGPPSRRQTLFTRTRS